MGSEHSRLQIASRKRENQAVKKKSNFACKAKIFYSPRYTNMGLGFLTMTPELFFLEATNDTEPSVIVK